MSICGCGASASADIHPKPAPRVDILQQGARTLGLELAPAQLECFAAYHRLLVEWNARFNLTAITTCTDVQIKHFLDSLSVARALPRAQLDGARLIDIGSGAGFPGVPLAIAFPQLYITLLEATGKKAMFLEHLIRELALENVQAIHARAEELAHAPAHRARYAFAVARAVAEMRTLVEYALPFMRVGGIFIAQKSGGVEAETRAAAHALPTLGGALRATIAVHLPTLHTTRYLVVVEKIAPTPDAYPRRAGVPEKKPL